MDSLKEQYEIEISETLSKSTQEAQRAMEEYKTEIERQKSRYEEERRLAEEDYCSKLESHMAIVKEKDSMINALSEQLEQLEVGSCVCVSLFFFSPSPLMQSYIYIFF